MLPEMLPERAERIRGTWEKIAPLTPLKVLDKIGELWITKILQSPEDTVRLFREDDTNDEIGLKHAGVTPFAADSRGFWEGVSRLAPELVNSDDLDYLIANDGNSVAAWALICALDNANPRHDALTSRLVDNALLYK